MVLLVCSVPQHIMTLIAKNFTFLFCVWNIKDDSYGSMVLCVHYEHLACRRRLVAKEGELKCLYLKYHVLGLKEPLEYIVFWFVLLPVGSVQR